MSASNIAIGLLALALAASLYWVRTYREEVQDLRTELTIERGKTESLRSLLRAHEKAHREREQAEKEINDVATQRNKLLDSLPSGWGNTLLPDECVRVFKYDPATPADSSPSTGGSHAAD